MSTKFFDTKKSGIVKKTKGMKRGIIAAAVVAVTAAAGIGGYNLINRDSRPTMAEAPVQNAPTANSYHSEPAPRASSSFLSFGDQQKPTATTQKHVSKKHGKHVASHGKRHHGKKFAKHGKKHHGKHLAKHSKKHGKHLAKHSKKHGKHVAKHGKKKTPHTELTTASR